MLLVLSAAEEGVLVPEELMTGISLAIPLVEEFEVLVFKVLLKTLRMPAEVIGADDEDEDDPLFPEPGLR